MDDKGYILDQLKTSGINKKPPLPKIKSYSQEEDLIKIFIDNLQMSGGIGIAVTKSDLISEIDKHTDDMETVYCAVPELADTLPQRIPPTDLKDLNKIDITILQGLLGVAENGAVWIDDVHMNDRRLPFISDRLLILLERRNIYFDLSEAYEQIQLDTIGFGLFIAGPSKTADIEQSLVIGAQGAKIHTVLII